MQLPDTRGYFGEFGGSFAPEILYSCLHELTVAYARSRRDAAFKRELAYYLAEYAGRPTRLYYAPRLSKFAGASIYLKREDLLHTGAHKINNSLGQAMLARFMGKRRIIAETGAGQHGVSAATVARLFSLTCDVYMGQEDMRRQRMNVFRMNMLGARVIPVTTGTKTLKDACSQAMRDWVTNVRDTYYLTGSTFGPHPYPMMVRNFQSVIGKEARKQILRKEKRLPDYLVACVGGGSNAMGLFYPFYKDTRVHLVGVEAGGTGRAHNAASMCYGGVGILHGAKTFILQDRDGQIQNTHSVAAGLDYPGVGPEHAYYHESGRGRYVAVKDKQALQGFKILSELEGIIPALESAHAIYYAARLAKKHKGSLIIVCLSGRGDKDLEIVQEQIEADKRR